MNKYFLVVLLSLFMQVAKVAAAPWQWSVEIKELISEETNASRCTAFCRRHGGYGYRKTVNKSVPSSSGNTI